MVLAAGQPPVTGPIANPYYRRRAWRRPATPPDSRPGTVLTTDAVLRAASEIPGTPNIPPAWSSSTTRRSSTGRRTRRRRSQPQVVPLPDPERGQRPLLESASGTSLTRRTGTHTEVALKPAEVGRAQTDPNVVPDARHDANEPGRARLDPDRQRGRVPARPRRSSRPPAHDLDHRPDPVRRRQCRQALAAARSGRAGGRDRRLLAVRRQDADPLQRRPAAFPARVASLRLLHGRSPT